MPYLSWWPVPFPYGRSRVPVIAPFWADFDFRNNVPTSTIYYNVYDRPSPNIFSRDIFRDFNARVDSNNFEAEWLLVVTWTDAIPYPWRYNLNEVGYTYNTIPSMHVWAPSI